MALLEFFDNLNKSKQKILLRQCNNIKTQILKNDRRILVRYLRAHRMPV